MVDPIRRALLLVSLAGLALGAAVGCSSQGTETKCSTSGCTVTFSRGVDAEVSVLGVKAELVRVKNNQATLDVEGHKVVVPVGGEREAEGFNVALKKVTKNEVVIRISAEGGG